ncbi:hypothetical protein HDV05_004780 [Chytridiales sp. JEL 0842]|nr:hypothetical protein HDV05_004780 [Chytridiales sp. JEL 0842]
MEQLEENEFKRGTDTCKWCPERDLFAMRSSETTGGDLAVYRLNWQRIWTYTPDNKDVAISAFAWRPDGRALAIALSNGGISLHDAETGSKFWSQDAIKDWKEGERYALMDWMEPAGQLEKNISVDPLLASSFIDDLPATILPSGTSNMEMFSSSENSGYILPQGSMTAIVAISNTGRVVILLWGIFKTASFFVSVPTGSKFRPLACFFTSNLTNLTILYELQTGQDVLCNSITYNTTLFQTHTDEFMLLSTLLSKYHECVICLLETFAMLEAEYDKAQAIRNQQLTLIRQKYAEEEDNAMWSEFLRLLATGVASATLESCLCETLGDRGLRRWKSVLTTSISSAKRISTIFLIPICYRIMLLLSDLASFARIDRYKEMGLREGLIPSISDKVSLLFSKLSEVACTLDAEHGNQLLLIDWLRRETNGLLGVEASEQEETGEVDADSKKLVSVLRQFLEMENKKATWLTDLKELCGAHPCMLESLRASIISAVSQKVGDVRQCLVKKSVGKVSKKDGERAEYFRLSFLLDLDLLCVFETGTFQATFYNIKNTSSYAPIFNLDRKYFFHNPVSELNDVEPKRIMEVDMVNGVVYVIVECSNAENKIESHMVAMSVNDCSADELLLNAAYGTSLKHNDVLQVFSSPSRGLIAARSHRYITVYTTFEE